MNDGIGIRLNNQLVFWILTVLGTFTLTIGGVMVNNMMSMNTNLAEVKTEMRMSREFTNQRLTALERDVKELRELRAAELGAQRAR